MANFLIPYTTPANYTYDFDLIEVISGEAKLKDLRPSDATIYFDFETDEDASWGDGSLLGTLVNGATVSSGFVDLTGQNGKHFIFDGAGGNCNNFGNSGHKGAIRFLYKPNFSGSSNEVIFELTGTSDKNTISAFQSGTSFAVRFFNSSGVSSGDLIGEFPSVVAGQVYEIEINIDFDGTSRTFIDGIQIASLNTSTITRTNEFIETCTFAKGGTDRFYLGKMIWFNDVQHTSNYTPGEAISSTIYSTASPTIYKTLGDSISDIEIWLHFIETLGNSNQGDVKYQLSVDGATWLYWNGSIWASAGASDYNIVGDVDANIGDFSTDEDKIYLKAFFISDGEQKVALDLNQIAYTTNTAPMVYAGTDKTATINVSLNPFSDASFSDVEGNITKAEWKIEGGAYVEISQGVYSTLLGAVQAFSYTTSSGGSLTLYLKVTDSFDASSEDTMIISTTKVITTINVKDSFGNHLPNVYFDPGDGNSICLENSPFTHTYEIGTYTLGFTKNAFVTLSELEIITLSVTALSYTMVKEKSIDDLIINVDIYEKLVLGDTFTMESVIDTNLTDYEIRCQITDKSGSNIKLATSNSGGSDSQIEVINASVGEFIITCAKALTTNFKNDISIEIEIENTNGQIRTIFKKPFVFESEDLTWTDPS